MLTLNIEDDTVRLAVSRGKRISFVAELPLTAGWVQNGVIIDRLAVAQHIIGMLVGNRIKERDVVTCVSAIHSIYRVVSVPKLDRALMAEAAKKEMERVSPVPLDTLYTSWQDIKTSGGGADLCLLGLPRDNVDSVMETMTLAGLKLKVLELKPLAVSRVVDESTAIAVNIQTSHFDITVMQDGIPELIRSLTFPQALMPDMDKAALIKGELDRTVNFHNMGHAEKRLGSSTACFFSGQLPAGVQQDIGYIVKPLPALLGYPVWVDTGRFAAITGMIISDLGGKSMMKLDINMIPRVAAPAKAAPTRRIYAPLIALIIGVLIIIAAFFLSISAAKETADLQSAINEQQKLVTDTQKTVTQQTAQENSQLDQYTQTLNSLKAPLDYLSQQRAYSNRDLGTVTSTLPAIMSLTSIHDDGSSLSLVGSAASSELILSYARELRKSDNFKSVDINSITNQSYIEFAFTMTLTLNR